jgi:tRNA pseudouridine32 synthase/23S rRNA pseudouridine746 synthase
VTNLLHDFDASGLEAPARFPSPFDDTGPHALARRAAEPLLARLRAGTIAPGVSTDVLRRAEGGKMFGVLVVRTTRGDLGALHAISGQLDRAWEVPGFVPPAFDPSLRADVEAAAERVVKDFTVRVEAARHAGPLLAAREALAALESSQATARAALKRELAAHRQVRREARARLEQAPGAGTPAADALRRLAELDDESRRDDRRRRALEAAWRAEHAAVSARLVPLERRLAALERLRRLISQEAMRRIWDSYRLTNFAGETTTLRALFPSGEPPSGAGDCAAPKLLHFARQHGLVPVALAEFWWGAPPPGGARVEGTFFPSCREKCGAVLPFLLRGLDVAPRQTWRPRLPASDEVRVLREDAHVVVVDKPEGLLSVPARDADITDNLVARLRRRFPFATGPLVVHRLDLDTSGVLVAALDLDTWRALQAQFRHRTVTKHYVALVEGEVRGDEGLIELPLRVDLEQRPRQVVDPVHGRHALTRWRVLERQAGRTRLALEPLTGRTHQLRVHCAHVEGLGCPIVGDRLYGVPGERLLLHAEALAFTHPVTGDRWELNAPAPF